MTTEQIEATYRLILSGAPNPIFDYLTTREVYYLAKAHELANLNHFLNFWNDGRDKTPLRQIIAEFYPPQNYNNTLEEAISHPGYEELQVYYNIATTVFKDI